MYNQIIQAENDTIDYEHLFKVRLIVARLGEMDNARWWNTKGILGNYGTMLLKRGFPQTHYFAQARIVFEVARNRCQEIFNLPGAVTLWSLSARCEEQFDIYWQSWIEQPDKWNPFF